MKFRVGDAVRCVGPARAWQVENALRIKITGQIGVVDYVSPTQDLCRVRFDGHHGAVAMLNEHLAPAFERDEDGYPRPPLPLPTPATQTSKRAFEFRGTVRR